uniref:Tc1-like transposase DDE domain-containing protein n=1 Tax=Planktothricoides sp. SpSt-374 TaxID=2282167 RepID=A0A7C3VIZ9_9CYAN
MPEPGVEYLPPYSPDFNPIEMLWSTVKSMTGADADWNNYV